MTKDKPSEKYLELIEAYKHLHEDETKFTGISLIPFAIDLYSIIQFNKCQSILDYGCGKATAYKENFKDIDPKKRIPNFTVPLHNWWGVYDLSLYDPGVPEHSTFPTKTADIVICTDVLEHIPEEDLDWLIREICSLANTTVFLNISCQLAKKTFTSGKYKGENVHVSVFDHAWWVDKIKTIHEDYKELKIYLTSTSKEGIMGTCIKGD
jgi:hypothetical protein